MIYDYETAQKQKKRMECKACGARSRLEVRFLKGQYDLWCPVCKNDSEFREIKSLTRQWKEDPDSIPLTIANKFEKKYGGSKMSDTALTTATEKSLVERVSACQWAKDMTPVEKRMLAGLAIQYGLDPLMGELVWYQGKPYIPLDGHIRIATRNAAYEGLDLRPMTVEERQAYGLEADKVPYAWIALVYKKGMRVPAKGIGTADPDRPHRSKFDPRANKYEGGNPVERERPWAMARARAANQALRTYFPHSIPGVLSDEDVDILVENGRIIDGQSRVVYEDEPGIIASPASDNTKTEQPCDDLHSVDEEAAAPEPDTGLPFSSSDEDEKSEVMARISNLMGVLKRTPNAAFLRWFTLNYGIEFADASAEDLEKLAHHLTDLILDREEKKNATNGA